MSRIVYFKSIIFAMTFFIVVFPTCPAAHSSVDEETLRAAVIIGILRFTDWPEDASISNEINICFLKEGPTSRAMNAVSGRELVQRKLIYSKIVEAKRNFADECNVLVLENTRDNKTITSLSDQAHQNNILTICNECAHNNIVLVNLIRKGNRIAFEINLAQARETGIFFSSALLELAAKVKQ